MTLRELRWQDIPELVRLEQELFATDAWAAPTWWAELAERPRRSYVVATDGGDITAYGGIDHGGEAADVMTIAVAPGRQGRGAGTTVLRRLMDDARAGGARHLMLEVRADNLAAQRLYERMGFSLLQTRRRYYQPGDVDALIMRAHLEHRAVTTSGEDAGGATTSGEDAGAATTSGEDGAERLGRRGATTEGTAERLGRRGAATKENRDE